MLFFVGGWGKVEGGLPRKKQPRHGHGSENYRLRARHKPTRHYHQCKAQVIPNPNMHGIERENSFGSRAHLWALGKDKEDRLGQEMRSLSSCLSVPMQLAERVYPTILPISCGGRGGGAQKGEEIQISQAGKRMEEGKFVFLVNKQPHYSVRYPSEVSRTRERDERTSVGMYKAF